MNWANKKKHLKYLAGLLFLGITLFVIYVIYPAYTPSIKSKNSIATLEFIKIGGVEQSILIRGENNKNPVLLFLHGGPGMPMMYLAHAFQKPLEKEFTVVHWDRRGAGKSFARKAPPKETMSVRQLLDDGYELVDHLRKRLHQDKIVLIGHSFGTYLGSLMVQERPDLFTAFVCIGQVVNEERARKIQKQFVISKSKQAGNYEIQQILENNTEADLEPYLFEYGAELKESKSFWPLIWEGLKSPEYSIKEVLGVAEGSQFSSTNMKYNVGTKGNIEYIQEYEIPIFFIVGINDYVTPFELVNEYFKQIYAPEKALYLFENSAHFPFYEEPVHFGEVILEINNNLNIKTQSK